MCNRKTVNIRNTHPTQSMDLVSMHTASVYPKQIVVLTQIASGNEKLDKELILESC